VIDIKSSEELEKHCEKYFWNACDTKCPKELYDICKAQVSGFTPIFLEFFKQIVLHNRKQKLEKLLND